MLLALPKDIIIHEINKYLVEIDNQILRKTCSFFSSLFSYKRIDFNDDGVVVEFVHLERYKKFWNVSTIKKITVQGDLKNLKYLRENGCPFDWMTIGYAVENGHLECLKYLHFSLYGNEPCQLD